MRIVILCSSLFAKAGRLYEKEALSFRKACNEVVIIAPFNKKYEDQKGIKIYGLSKKRGYLDRLYINFLIMLKGLFTQADVWYCHDVDSLVVGIVLRLIKGGKVVFDCHEYFPEKQREKWGKKMKLLGEIMFHFVNLYERIFYRFTDAIVAVNAHMAGKLKRLHPAVFIFPNYPRLNFMQIEDNLKIVLPEKTILYIGGLNSNRNIHGVLHVLSILRKEYRCEAYFAVFGGGDSSYIEYLNTLAKDLGISEYFIYGGEIPYKEIPSVLKEAQIGIFLLNKKCLSHHWGESIKFFEYAAAGLPVIISDLPAKRRLLEIFKNGYAVDPTNEKLVAEICYKLINNPHEAKKMGESGRRCFLERYNWEAIEPEIEKLFLYLT